MKNMKVVHVKTKEQKDLVTKITEFLDFGATFDLDRIFSFFFHI